MYCDQSFVFHDTETVEYFFPPLALDAVQLEDSRHNAVIKSYRTIEAESPLGKQGLKDD